MNPLQTVSRTVILKLIVAGMQLCWLYAVIYLINAHLATRSWPLKILISAYPTAIGLYAGLFIVRVRWLQELIGILSISIYLSIAFKFTLPDEGSIAFMPSLRELLEKPREILFNCMPYLVLGAAASAQWGLGRRLVRQPSDFVMLLVEFQLGFACLLTALALEYRFGIRIAMMNLIIIFFFVFSLSGIALARLNETAMHRNHPFFPDSFIYLCFSSVTIGLLPLVVLMLINPQIIDLILDFVRSIKQLFLVLVDYIMALLPEQQWRTLELEDGVSVGCGNFSGVDEPLNSGDHDLGRILYNAIWIGFFLFALWRISNSVFDYFKKRYANPSQVTRHHLTGAFKADLHAFLIFLCALIIQSAENIAALITHRLPLRLTPWKPLSMGQIYRDILRWSASAGFERESHQTPHEHCGRVSRRRPEAGKGLLFITNLFAANYYGNHPPCDEDYPLLMEEWRRLKKVKLKKRDNGKRGVWLLNQIRMFQRLKRSRQGLLQTSPRSLSVKKSPSN